jgi:glycosyltransferase involved in cell wall biosynthesis
MTATVLYDQSATALRMGTGIATYARNLATAAQNAGYGTDVLLSTEAALDKRNPVLSEVRLFDAPRRSAFPWFRPVRDFIRGAVRTPFGYRPDLMLQADVVMRPSSAGAGGFANTYVAARLFEEARSGFMLHGRAPVVTLPSPPALFHATHPLPLRVKGCANIVTIHDLVPLRLPYMSLDNKTYFYKLIAHLVATADHILTVSDYSRADIISLFKVPEDRITNTYQAVTLPARVLARSDEDIAREVENLFEVPPRGYYLFVGALEPKKNVARLIDAYAASGSKYPLIIAGGAGWQNEAELERIGDARFANWRVQNNVISSFKRVRRIPYLPPEQLFTLMRGARALLFPSVFEGFGLPVLEAMTLGTPVLTSNVTSLPEVAGDAAMLVDPRDTLAMADAIRTLDADTDLLASLSVRGRARARAFSMEAYNVRVRDAYARILGSSAAR